MPQYRKKGGHRFSSHLLLRKTGCHQYYIIATSTVFFYDFFLTLADEVTHVISVSFAAFTDPPAKDQIRLAGEEIMGYVEMIGCRTASVDDLIVFTIFLAVRSAPQLISSFLKGQRRTGTFRSHTKFCCCIVSGIAIHTCHTRSCFANPGTASYDTTFHQRVSIVSIGESGLTRVILVV